MNWFKNILPKVMTSQKKGVPEGVWIKCVSCQSVLYKKDLQKNFQVCSKCGHHFHLSPKDRIDMLLDKDSRQLIGENVGHWDMFKFKDTKKYKDRIHAAVKKTGEKEALHVASGLLGSQKVVVACFNFAFIGGTMGTGVGSRFVLAVEAAIEAKCPLIVVSSSGGARMQEGVFALMQMARTSAALTLLTQARLPFISVLANPTFGGVTASFAMLGDVILAEEGALIGFTGPRIMNQTIGEKLPEGFQRSSFLLKHGGIDQVVHRHDLKARLVSILKQLSFSRRDLNG